MSKNEFGPIYTKKRNLQTYINSYREYIVISYSFYRTSLYPIYLGSALISQL